MPDAHEHCLLYAVRLPTLPPLCWTQKISASFVPDANQHCLLYAGHLPTPSPLYCFRFPTTVLALYHTLFTFNDLEGKCFWKYCGKKKKMLVVRFFLRQRFRTYHGQILIFVPVLKYCLQNVSKLCHFVWNIKPLSYGLVFLKLFSKGFNDPEKEGLKEAVLIGVQQKGCRVALRLA